MTLMISKFSRRLASLAAVAMLVAAMGGSWTLATAAPTSPAQQRATAVKPTAAATPQRDDADDPPVKRSNQKQVAGKLNLNTATEEQLMMLPTVGPSKAERVIAWRKTNGGFKRTADLRRVKGFGYKTFKKLEPFLDIKGDTTLVAK
jgi:competence ComEA-like helix-hairpin-helix protein